MGQGRGRCVWARCGGGVGAGESGPGVGVGSVPVSLGQVWGRGRCRCVWARCGDEGYHCSAVHCRKKNVVVRPKWRPSNSPSAARKPVSCQVHW